MATLEPNEIMFTPFEPKTKNRFIMYIDGIPAYLIKAMNRPQIQFEEIVLDHINVKRYIKGKAQWQPIDIVLYDPERRKCNHQIQVRPIYVSGSTQRPISN